MNVKPDLLSEKKQHCFIFLFHQKTTYILNSNFVRQNLNFYVLCHPLSNYIANKIFKPYLLSSRKCCIKCKLNKNKQTIERTESKQREGITTQETINILSKPVLRC